MIPHLLYAYTGSYVATQYHTYTYTPVPSYTIPHLILMVYQYLATQYHNYTSTNCTIPHLNICQYLATQQHTYVYQYQLHDTTLILIPVPTTQLGLGNISIYCQ